MYSGEKTYCGITCTIRHANRKYALSSIEYKFAKGYSWGSRWFHMRGLTRGEKEETPWKSG